MTEQRDLWPLDHDTDVESSLRSLVPSAVRTQLRQTATLAAIAAGMQITETTAFDLVVGLGVTTATGAQLDRLGRIAGVQRLGLSDGVYRRFIQAQIRANYSDGTRATVQQVFAIITGDANATIQDLYPASVYGSATVEEIPDASTLVRMGEVVQRSLPAGVGFDFVLGTPGVLRFDVSDPGFDGPPMGVALPGT